MGIKHLFVSTKPESPDPTLVGASSWNDDHVIDVVAPIGLTGATAPSRYAGGTTAGAPTVGSFLVGDYVVAQDGRLFICTSPGSPGTWAAGATNANAVVVLDGGWWEIEAGQECDLSVDFPCDVSLATMLADQAGVCDVDVWKAPYASFPPTAADAIGTLSMTGVKSSAVVDWSIDAGDVLRFHVAQAANVRRVVITLKLARR